MFLRFFWFMPPLHRQHSVALKENDIDRQTVASQFMRREISCNGFLNEHNFSGTTCVNICRLLMFVVVGIWLSVGGEMILSLFEVHLVHVFWEWIWRNTETLVRSKLMVFHFTYDYKTLSIRTWIDRSSPSPFVKNTPPHVNFIKHSL